MPIAAVPINCYSQEITNIVVWIWKYWGSRDVAQLILQEVNAATDTLNFAHDVHNDCYTFSDHN